MHHPPPPDPTRPPMLLAVPDTPLAGPVGPGETFGHPGASAAAYYHRRRAAEWTLYQRYLPLRLAGVALAGVVADLAAQQVAPALAGWATGLAAVVLGWRLRFRVSQDAHNWQRGARGERRTARQLDRLTRHGWVVFHDLAIPDSRANADHLIIGPAGVFLADSKNWRGHLAFAPDGTLWHGSYPLTATLATIGFEAAAIAGALAVPGLAVEPLLVVHGSTIPWGEQYLGGVAVLPARRLVATLLALPPLLTDEQVTQLAQRAVTRLRPVG
jgi:Nuclease-related domain